MDVSGAPKIVAVASRARLESLSEFFSRKREPVSWFGTTSVTRLEALLQDTTPELIIMEASFSRPFARWQSLLAEIRQVIVISEDPELDWVELGRLDFEETGLRIVRPDGLFVALSSGMAQLSSLEEEELKTQSRHRLELPVPTSVRRGVVPLSGGHKPVQKTARLRLTDGFYDLSRCSLKNVASRVASDRRTGVLRIRNGKETAELHFLLGQPQRAFFSGLEGVAALARFAHWDRGYATWSNDSVSLTASLDPDTARFLIGMVPPSGCAS